MPKSCSMLFIDLFSAFILGIPKIKIDQNKHTIEGMSLEFKPMMIILIINVFVACVTRNFIGFKMNDNSISSLINEQKYNIEIYFPTICSTETSKERFSTFKFFINTVSSN